MPFCIIFFAITIIYLVFFVKGNKTIFLILHILLGASSVFFFEYMLATDIYINIAFVLFIAINFGLSLVYVKKQKLLLWILLIIAYAFIYRCIVRYNIFYSIDYNLIAVALISIPIILLCAYTMADAIFLSTTITLIIFIEECFYWWKELQYIKINIVNLLNLFTILLGLGIVKTSLVTLNKKRGFYEKYN